MSKAMLVLDEMPNSCIECPCRTKNLKDEDVCNCLYENNKLKLYDLMHKKPDWCPLKEIPEKQIRDYPWHLYDRYILGYDDGWDNCIDEILGE